MKPNNDELLSALMDEELSEWQLRKLLKAAEQDPELLQRWTALHEQEAARHGWPDLNVLAALNAELDASEGPGRTRRRGTVVRLSSLIAASAASVLVAVSALVFWPAGSSDTVPGVTASSVEPLSPYWQTHAQYATYQAGQRWDEVEASTSGSH